MPAVVLDAFLPLQKKYTPRVRTNDGEQAVCCAKLHALGGVSDALSMPNVAFDKFVAGGRAAGVRA